MAEYWAQDPGPQVHPDQGSAAHRATDRFAARITARRESIMASFTERMEDAENPLVSNPYAMEQVLLVSSAVIDDVAESIRVGHVRIDDGYRLLCWSLGEAAARSHLTPADSLRAAVILFEVSVDAMTSLVNEDTGLMPSFVVAILALNESTTVRIREATLAYTGALLNRIHHAHLEERRRIARELHDQLGEGLSVALRHLELDKIISADRSPSSSPQVATSKDALVEAMRRLRLVISDLRHDPVTSLEKALSHYLTSIEPGVDVRLRVNGDETWAAPTVIDETYLIVREAIRNAVAHADPGLILVKVDLAPHELRASVVDNGRGFIVTKTSDPEAQTNAGLASMRERAILIGGRLTISSAPGQGTHVELLVPLPGQRDEL